MTTIPSASTVVITGASRNLGERLAIELLADAPERHVVALVRSPAGLADRLRAESGNPNVHVVACDLGDLASVRAAAVAVGELLEQPGAPPLHALVANAGIQRPDTSAVSVDGFELTFATNVLANQLLIGLLAEHLVVPGRIVVVGSGTHHDAGRERMWMVPGPRWAPVEQLVRPSAGKDAPHRGVGRRTYATSKLANIYQVHEFARRLPTGIDIYTYDPGLMPGTGLAREGTAIERLLWGTLLHVLRLLPDATSPTASARHLARLTVGPRPADTGAYVALGKVTPSSPASYDPDREAELWRVANDLVGLTARQDATGETREAQG